MVNLDPTERNRKNAIDYMNHYMLDLEFPKPTQKQLRRNYNYRIQFKSVFKENELLELLPPYLRNPAMFFLYRNTLPKLPWLCALEAKQYGEIRLSWIPDSPDRQY